MDFKEGKWYTRLCPYMDFESENGHIVFAVLIFRGGI
jgi:hypothetical protein